MPPRRAELPPEMKEKIEGEMKGEDIKLLIAERELCNSETNPDYFFTISEDEILEEARDFLTHEEAKILKNTRNTLQVSVLGPNLGVSTVSVRRMRKRKNTEQSSGRVYKLWGWEDIVERSRLKEGHKLQLWSFRMATGDEDDDETKLGFALVNISQAELPLEMRNKIEGDMKGEDIKLVEPSRKLRKAHVCNLHGLIIYEMEAEDFLKPNEIQELNDFDETKNPRIPVRVLDPNLSDEKKCLLRRSRRGRGNFVSYALLDGWEFYVVKNDLKEGQKLANYGLLECLMVNLELHSSSLLSQPREEDLSADYICKNLLELHCTFKN